MNKGFDIKQILNQLKKYWYVIPPVLALTIGLAYYKGLYSPPPNYRFATTILLKEGGASQGGAEALFGKSQNAKLNMTNELMVLKSFPLILSTLSKLDFNVSYYNKGKFKNTELYGDNPIELTLFDKTGYPKGVLFLCEYQDSSYFSLSKKNPSTEEFDLINKYQFGESFKIEGKECKIDLKDFAKGNSFKTRNILFRFNNVFDLVRSYANNLRVKPISSNSTILELSISGQNANKAKAFLNMLTETIVEQDINERNYNDRKTEEFINQHLGIFGDSLSKIGREQQYIRNKFSARDLGTEVGNTYGRIQSLEQEKQQIELTQKYYDYLKDAFSKENDNLKEVVVPSVYGIQDGFISSTINELVTLQREVKLFVGQEGGNKNPRYLETLQRIKELKLNILSNINSLEETDKIRLNDINSRIASFEKTLERLPSAERRQIEIQRKYALNENLYVMLMQRKLEAGIRKASSTSKYKLLNKAYQDGGPRGISSNKTNYLIAIVLGLGLPLGLMYLPILLNTKVLSKEELKGIKTIPVLGAVAHDSSKNLNVFSENFKPESVVIESFRMVRANLKFISSHKDSQITTVTSSTSNEGKSFCSNYLGFTLGLAGSKVLIIDADLRKPKKENVEYGLSDYLLGLAHLEDIILTTTHKNVYRIPSGALPSNPSELLMSNLIPHLIERLRTSFDHIIIDTSPLGIVFDSIPLMQSADINIYVVRNGLTKYAQLKEVEELNQTYQFSNLAFLFNDDKTFKSKYFRNKYQNYIQTAKVKV